MVYAFSADLATSYLSAAASLTVGTFVLLRARWPLNATLGGWLLCLGIDHATDAAWLTAPTYPLARAWVQVGWVAWGLAAVLAIWFVANLTRFGVRGKAVAATATAYLLAVVAWQLARPDAFTRYVPAREADPFWAVGASMGIGTLETASLWLLPQALVAPLLVLTLALYYRRRPEAERPGLRIILLLLLVQGLFVRVDELVFEFREADAMAVRLGPALMAGAAVANGMGVLVFGAALWATHRADGGRNAGRWTLAGAAAFLGVLTGAFLDNDNPLLRFAFGLMGLLFPLGMAYAALRGQFPGLDRRARITVRSGTLAAMFLAAGFIASEAAAEFFGAKSGNEYWGIAAAGLLVFAIAPMQRIADRVANATLPDAPPGAGDVTVAWEEMVRLAWADGRVSPAERLRLDLARERLGIDAGVAARVERAVLEDLARA